MAASGRLSTLTPQPGAEDPTGVLGAVVRAAGSPHPVRIEQRGFLLATTLDSARTVLTRPDDFTLPFDASRRPVSGDRPPGLPVLTPAAVALGRQLFASALSSALADIGDRPTEVDTLDLLRASVSLSTTGALIPDLDDTDRDQVADRVVAWVDALGPVISALDPPRRWSRVRRTERRAWRNLLTALRDVGAPDPELVGTALAAGVQVPIAAGAWCLVVLAGDPALQDELRAEPDLALPFVWEVLRLYPPTWLLPRITAREVTLAGSLLPPYTPVVVSPVALGRLPTLVPGPDLHRIDPHRWDGDVRPGAWLPFGAGPHACPGRNLGLAQLTELTRRASNLDLESLAPIGADASRGLSPSTSRILLQRHRPTRRLSGDV